MQEKVVSFKQSKIFFREIFFFMGNVIIKLNNIFQYHLFLNLINQIKKVELEQKNLVFYSFKFFLKNYKLTENFEKLKINLKKKIIKKLKKRKIKYFNFSKIKIMNFQTFNV